MLPSRPSLAMLPVSTRIEETDMAPGVRGSAGKLLRLSASGRSGSATEAAGEAVGEATGVSSPPSCETSASPACLTGSGPFEGCEFLPLAALLDLLRGGVSVPARPGSGVPVLGELLALTDRGVTAAIGTGALPPPRLTTRCLSSA